MNSSKSSVTHLGSKRRPLKLGRSTNVLWTILPTIAVVAALFLGFSYMSYFLREFGTEKEVTVRGIDGVVAAPKPYVEQVPPMAPEEAVEVYWQRVEAERLAAGEDLPPEPVLEEEVVPLAEIELKPVALPPLEVPGVESPSAP